MFAIDILVSVRITAIILIFPNFYSMFSLGLLELCLFLRVAAAATLGSSSFPLMLPSSNTSSLANSTLGVSDLSVHPSPEYICDPRNYPEANIQSCTNAASLIDGSRARLHFAQRHSGADGIAVPYNWVSGMLFFYLSAVVRTSAC